MERQCAPELGMGAVIDGSGCYRYSLWREWDVNAPRVVFVLLNPSTADGTHDDPTIRRCIHFARSWRYGSLEVVNLFAYRATDPTVLRSVADPVGPENDRFVVAAHHRARTTVAAWGNHGTLLNRDQSMLRLLSEDRRVYCLGLTKAGQPRHVLYVRGSMLLGECISLGADPQGPSLLAQQRVQHRPQ